MRNQSAILDRASARKADCRVDWTSCCNISALELAFEACSRLSPSCSLSFRSAKSTSASLMSSCRLRIVRSLHAVEAHKRLRECFRVIIHNLKCLASATWSPTLLTWLSARSSWLFNRFTSDVSEATSRAVSSAISNRRRRSLALSTWSARSPTFRRTTTISASERFKLSRNLETSS